LEQILQILFDKEELKFNVANLCRFYNRHIF